MKKILPNNSTLPQCFGCVPAQQVTDGGVISHLGMLVPASQNYNSQVNVRKLSHLAGVCLLSITLFAFPSLRSMLFGSMRRTLQDKPNVLSMLPLIRCSAFSI